MTKFIDSLRKGLDSAELARKNKEEINQVFEQLSSEIKDFTNSQVILQLSQSYDSETDNVFRSALLSNLHDFIGPQPGRYYTAIIATSSSEDSNSKELAEWNVNEDGYPVIISYAGNRVSCNDKESLIEGLSDFLACTSVAEKIQSLLD